MKGTPDAPQCGFSMAVSNILKHLKVKFEGVNYSLNGDDGKFMLPNSLVNRIKDSRKRPLVINTTDNELIKLINKRSHIYSKALYEIKCDNLSKIEIVKKVIKIYETN